MNPHDNLDELLNAWLSHAGTSHDGRMRRQIIHDFFDFATSKSFHDGAASVRTRDGTTPSTLKASPNDLFEHDGAFECLICHKRWGQISGPNVLPGPCVHHRPPVYESSVVGTVKFTGVKGKLSRRNDSLKLLGYEIDLGRIISPDETVVLDIVRRIAPGEPVWEP